MTVMHGIGGHLIEIVIWGFVASAAMATLLEGAQLSGYTRMSIPFLFGAFLSGDRRSAIILGYILYLIGGLAFAFLYAFCLQTLQVHSIGAGCLVGSIIGVAHGVFLIAAFLPLLPYIHPRLATDYDGADALARLEPPGAFALNYGWATPFSTLVAQTLFGMIFGIGYGASLSG